MPVICDYCRQPAELVSGAVIHPKHPHLRSQWFWRCAPCAAWVGCHANTKDHQPLGRLANAELRQARQGAHAIFDSLWRSGEMTRPEAYVWLANALHIQVGRCHIGWMDVDNCNRVMDAVLARPDARSLIARSGEAPHGG